MRRNLEKESEMYGEDSQQDIDEEKSSNYPACPICGGYLIEIRQKLQCSQCRRICETCCEGGQG